MVWDSGTQSTYADERIDNICCEYQERVKYIIKQKNQIKIYNRYEHRLFAK